jgi:hypothetical protein
MSNQSGRKIRNYYHASVRSKLVKVRQILILIAFLTSLVGVNPTVVAAAPAGTALQFNGSNQYATFGPAAALGVQTFTIETWLRKTGAGVTTTTGTGGITAVPLVTKGRDSGENSNVDINFFFGIDSTGVLAADFEECSSTMGAPCTAAGAGGQNYPAKATTVIQNNVWYHAAVTYDGQNWKFYLNGIPDGITDIGTVHYPRWDSIQHAGLGTAMNSTGSAVGFFAGILDEVRIWNVALSESAIQTNMYNEIPSASNLIGRWGMNEARSTLPGTFSGSSTECAVAVTERSCLWARLATSVWGAVRMAAFR